MMKRLSTRRVKICAESFKALLRFGRKNDGPWNECECEECYLPDDTDAEWIVQFLKTALGVFKEESKKTCNRCEDLLTDLASLRSELDSEIADSESESEFLKETGSFPVNQVEQEGFRRGLLCAVERLRDMLQLEEG